MFKNSYEFPPSWLIFVSRLVRPIEEARLHNVMRSYQVMQYFSHWALGKNHVLFKMAFRLCRFRGISKRLQDVFKVTKVFVCVKFLFLCGEIFHSSPRENKSLVAAKNKVMSFQEVLAVMAERSYRQSKVLKIIIECVNMWKAMRFFWHIYYLNYCSFSFS